jgi:hypothetical protein
LELDRQNARKRNNTCRFGGLSIVFKQGLAPFAPLAGDWHPNR